MEIKATEDSSRRSKQQDFIQINKYRSLATLDGTEMERGECVLIDEHCDES